MTRAQIKKLTDDALRTLVRDRALKAARAETVAALALPGSDPGPLVRAIRRYLDVLDLCERFAAEGTKHQRAELEQWLILEVAP